MSRPQAPATIGIVGLGLLGSAIAARLRASGYPVVGHDIVPACVERLVALGGTAAKSAAEVARASDAVLTVLPRWPPSNPRSSAPTASWPERGRARR